MDFLYETFFNINRKSNEKFTDVNVENKLNNINLIKQKNLVKEKTKLIEELSSINTLDFNTSLPFILKRDIVDNKKISSVSKAKCLPNDIDNGISCIVKANNFYYNNSSYNNFNINVMPDGYSTTKNNISTYNYDIVITNVTPNQPLSVVRQTNFYFPDDKNIKNILQSPRQFNYVNKYDQRIINYFNNYAKYNNLINSNLTNQLLTGIDNNDQSLISSYFTILSNLLLLKNIYSGSPSNSPSPSILNQQISISPSLLSMQSKSTFISYFNYNSGYYFDINDIKQNIIFLYNNIISDPNINAVIDLNIIDKTHLKFYYNTTSHMDIYTFELYPEIQIIFKNLSLSFNSDMPKSLSNTVWSLYYLQSLTENSSAGSITFTYNDCIKYPIALPFSLPRSLSWDTDSNGIVPYMTHLFNINNSFINNITIIDPLTSKNVTDGLKTVTKNITDFLQKIGNTNLKSITDIFILYDPISYNFQSWIFTNILDPNTNKKINYPLITFVGSYYPVNCEKGTLHNSYCIPKCPPNYSYDLGLICLSNDFNNYFPESKFCTHINSLKLQNIPSDSIMSGFIKSCDPNYYTQTTVITQSNISTFKNVEDFNNVNVNINTNNINNTNNNTNNILHFSPFL
jgi:hypothetical protein